MDNVHIFSTVLLPCLRILTLSFFVIFPCNCHVQQDVTPPCPSLNSFTNVFVITGCVRGGDGTVWVAVGGVDATILFYNKKQAPFTSSLVNSNSHFDRQHLLSFIHWEALLHEIVCVFITIRNKILSQDSWKLMLNSWKKVVLYASHVNFETKVFFIPTFRFWLLKFTRNKWSNYLFHMQPNTVFFATFHTAFIQFFYLKIVF